MCKFGPPKREVCRNNIYIIKKNLKYACVNAIFLVILQAE